ncbi:MAG: hypothetical protein WA061_02790 [Microgenomates group bacterium]
MGRKKKSANTANEVESFSTTKEDQLEIFTKKKLVVTIPKEVIEKYGIKPLPRVIDLRGKCFESFTGKNYEGALKAATEWKDAYNEEKNHEKKIDIVDFYPQLAFGCSIIVSYNLI